MLSKDKYLEIHSKFYDQRQFVRLLNKYLSYENYNISSSYATGGKWMIFHRQSSDFTMILLNEINLFNSTLRDLYAWDKVMKDYSGDMQFNILIEIFDPFCIYALNIPNAVKNRFIYASVYLLRETATLLDRNIEYIDFSERNINLGLLEKIKCLFTKHGRKSVEPFIQAVSNLHGEQFREDTDEFRHRFHHRIPPQIETGISSPLVTIERTVDSIKYGFGGKKALPTETILRSLTCQHFECVKVFEAFWVMLNELLEIWKEKCA